MSEAPVPEKRGPRRPFSKPKWKPPISSDVSSNGSMQEKDTPPIEKWSMGILNDTRTEEVPGTVLLLSANRNEPLGMRHAPERRSSVSSLPSPYPERRRSSLVEKKRTPNGEILLDPQPDDSMNDPLNWPALRRDCALLSLGFYCMVGGGMTPILAAGFSNVANTFDVSYARVALTTGLYMMGLGVGSVVFSPTAILYGKRPVYLASSIMFVATSIWCARANDYASLAAARVFQGISVSPVECLPSATIAEIFFLHERAFRVGIYTLLLLGGKNLIPLVSAAIIQAKGWRWVFWIVAIVAGFGFVVLFLFVPETFWDRTPRPKSRRPTVHRSFSSLLQNPLHRQKSAATLKENEEAEPDVEKIMTPRQQRLHEENVHARFIEPVPETEIAAAPERDTTVRHQQCQHDGPGGEKPRDKKPLRLSNLPPTHLHQATVQQIGAVPVTPHLHNLNSPYYLDLERKHGYLDHHNSPEVPEISVQVPQPARIQEKTEVDVEPVKLQSQEDTPISPISDSVEAPKLLRYTTNLRQAPPLSYKQTLKAWNGRLTKTSWLKVAIRPFILYSYPAVLWSALVYSLSVGWLIVLSESVSHIYRTRDSYNFSALGVGLVYISPFIGGVLGTAVAGKVSDIIVRYMSRKNGGVYEPEFRLVMAIPVAISTAVGLMGFGWSAQEHDKWIVPTFFFGVISFGCSLGSTTSITFCVDSYRQYAGEALVTLNFSKNIFHGLVFSLFFPNWLEKDGPKDVFLVIGGIQIVCLLTTIPMYIYGKRARMITVRKKWMERFQ